jgi:hypothetical protein
MGRFFFFGQGIQPESLQAGGFIPRILCNLTKPYQNATSKKRTWKYLSRIPHPQNSNTQPKLAGCASKKIECWGVYMGKILVLSLLK